MDTIYAPVRIELSEEYLERVRDFFEKYETDEKFRTLFDRIVEEARKEPPVKKCTLLNYLKNIFLKEKK